jgi:polysaccharide pyruvyl transferase CsaB
MAKSDYIYKIGISGSYGGLNLGDEAILQGIVTPLRASLPVEITVFSRDPDDTLRRHQVDRAVPVREMSRNESLSEIRRLDLLVLGGGGLLFDAEAGIYLREVQLAQESDIPVMVYAIGAGPLNDPKVQKLVREALSRVASVTVRDRKSQQLLEEIGVDKKLLITADPALLIEPEPLPPGALAREGMDDEGRKIIGLSVREPGGAAPDIDEESYHTILANAADFMVDRFDADVVLVPMEREELDIQHSHAVIARMLRAPRAGVLKGKYTSAQLLSLIGRFEFLVGMRLHALIFAALSGVPFVALPYGSKVHGFLQEFKFESPPMRLVNAGRLIAHIDQSWDRRRSLQTRISQVVPGLRSRAMRNNEILVSLLSGQRAQKDALASGTT